METNDRPRNPLDAASGQREEQIALILADCSDRLNAGEDVDTEKILSQHADLEPELKLALDALKDIPQGEKPAVPFGALLPGDTLGEYKIVCKVGSGGMGIVYEA